MPATGWQYAVEQKITAMMLVVVLVFLVLLAVAGVTGIGVRDTRDPAYSLRPAPAVALEDAVPPRPLAAPRPVPDPGSGG
jgi:hypothetical protein